MAEEPEGDMGLLTVFPQALMYPCCQLSTPQIHPLDLPLLKQG